MVNLRTVEFSAGQYPVQCQTVRYSAGKCVGTVLFGGVQWLCTLDSQWIDMSNNSGNTGVF